MEENNPDFRFIKVAVLVGRSLEVTNLSKARRYEWNNKVPATTPVKVLVTEPETWKEK